MEASASAPLLTPTVAASATARRSYSEELASALRRHWRFTLTVTLVTSILALLVLRLSGAI